MYKTESSILKMIMFQYLTNEKKVASQDQVKIPREYTHIVLSTHCMWTESTKVLYTHA